MQLYRLYRAIIYFKFSNRSNARAAFHFIINPFVYSLPLCLPSYFISDLSKNPKTKFSANIFPSKILQQRSSLFVCVAKNKKKRGQGINHRSSRIFLARGCETEGGAGSSTRLLSYSRIRRRGTKVVERGREGRRKR